MTPQELVAELEQKLAAAKAVALGQTEIPAEVTVVIPTLTALSWPHDLVQVFYRVQYGAQSIPLHMLISPQAPMSPAEDDGTIAWLKDRAAHPEQRPARDFKSFRVLEPCPNAGNLGDNLCRQMKRTCELIQTPFIWFVEDDTIPTLAPGIARQLLEALKADPTLAMICDQYERSVDHPNMGCTMARTDVMKQIGIDPGWKHDGNCVCRWLYQTELPRRGLRSANLAGWYATHLKNEG